MNHAVGGIGDTMPGYLLCQSDARTIPLTDRSVHCVICSPPYFGLRDYSTGRWEGGDDPACDHSAAIISKHGGWDGNNKNPDGTPRESRYAGTPSQMSRACRKCGARRIDRQIGLESSIEAYVDVMVRVFREVKRVLRDDGTLWLNMGDAYAQTTLRHRRDTADADWSKSYGMIDNSYSTVFTGLAPKNLLGMPWRVAFALQADGWVLRSDLIWAKANPMPESCRDRPTKSHEYLFLLSKKSTYFYDAEAVREDNSETSHTGGQYRHSWKYESIGHGSSTSQMAVGIPIPRNGRNLRSVLTLPTESWPGAHFATFPRKLVEPCIKAGSSERGCCPRCGAGWTRVMERGEQVEAGHVRGKNAAYCAERAVNGESIKRWTSSTLGWHASCQCPPHAPVPAVILDPFAGSGTTLVVANALGRHAIGLDLSREYLTNQAQRRLERPHAMPLRPARVEPAMPLFREEN